MEEGWIVGYGTVLEDQGKYKMWYTTVPPAFKIDQNESFLCYAESEDGIHWIKPNLGTVFSPYPLPSHEG